MQKVWLHRTRPGILLVEVIISIAVFVLFAAGAIYLLTAGLLTSQTAKDHATAAAYLAEGMEAVQALDQAAWNALADSPDSTYGLVLAGDTWELTADPDHPSGASDFTRTIEISDVYRDSSGNPSDDDTDTFDPHTRKVTVTLEWTNLTGTSQDVTNSVYVTDWDDVATIDDTIAEWSDGTLTNARVSSVDDGELQIIQPTLEVDSVIATNSWQTITLDNEYEQAVVVASVLDGNNPNSPVSVRVSNVTTTTFDIRLQFPTDNFAPSSTNSETVYYLVMEAGVWTLGDGATKIEAGIAPDISRVNCSTCGGWNNGTDVFYQQTYSAAPVVLHQVVTDNDSSWITSFVSDDTNAFVNPGTDGFQVALNGAESTTTHSAEDIAYIVFASEVTDSFEGVNFETDLTGNVVRGYTDAHRVENFDQTYTSAPLVLASQLSARSTDGSWAMIDAVTATRVTLYDDEDQTTDTERSHVVEYGAYVTFATSGTYYLNAATAAYDEPPMEVGVITNTTTGQLETGSATATTSWSTITLINTYVEPVVIATVQDGNNPNTPLSARVRNASGNSFELRLDIPTDNFAPATSNSETVNYLVVEAGVWTVGDSRTKIEANVVEDVARVNCRTCGSWNNGTDVFYRNAYSVAPVVLHQVMSENDATWITSFASDDTAGGNPPGTDGFQVAMNGAEVTATHSAEDIGYVVIAADVADTDGSLTFETDKTGDVVQGYTDAHTTEAFTNTYTTAPIVVASQVAMDGIEGCWAMLDNVTTTQLTVYVDEDQTLDTERSHTTEDYFYVAFSGSGSMELRDQTFLDDPVIVTLQNTYTDPVVVTTPYFTNDLRSPASIRVYDVSTNTFTAKLDAPADNFPIVNTTFSDDVYYLVVEAGTWQIGDLKIEAHVDTISTVNSYANGWTGTTTTFDHAYTGAPIVLHQVMSNNDSSWITSWASRTADRTNPPRTSGFQLGLNAAEVTTSNAHAAEDIGWIAFNNVGSGTVDSVAFRTFAQTELPFGHLNGCYTFTPGGTYSTPIPLIAQNSMDGSEGSWPSVCSLTTTTVGVHVEEDDYADSERSHTDEALGAIVFDGLFDYAGSTNPDNHTSATYTSPVLGDGVTWRNYNVLDWVEDVACTNCDIQVQVRTGDSLAVVAAATYVGPDGTSATYYDAGEGDLFPYDSIGALYVQYEVTMSGTTIRSPRLDDLSIWAYEN
ncbi:MAG: hypothetical protein HY565_01605 [Candidatus Kerfeldbacteria bacterium]|nr:hypothetical protein [Candidatus Kerfeldbacteria bacterium]